jgi:hypothetical protein
MLDISNIYQLIKHLNLKKYNCPFPVIFISAQDPDDACALVFDELIKIIMDQDPSIKMRIVCRTMKIICRIDKIYCLA